MIDLHSHLIPKVDDGPTSIEESISIIEELKKIGYKRLILTPHWNDINRELYLKGEVEKGFFLLKESCNGIELELSAEIMFNDIAREYLEIGKLPTYPGSKSILIEFPQSEVVPPNFERLLFEIKAKGILPIIAHPERYPFLQKDSRLIERLFDMEIGLLGDLVSLGGKFGWGIKRITKEWLKKGYFHGLATDIHRFKEIKYLKKGLKIAKEILKEEFSKFMKEYPLLLLNGELFY